MDGQCWIILIYYFCLELSSACYFLAHLTLFFFLNIFFFLSCLFSSFLEFNISISPLSDFCSLSWSISVSLLDSVPLKLQLMSPRMSNLKTNKQKTQPTGDARLWKELENVYVIAAGWPLKRLYFYSISDAGLDSFISETIYTRKSL